MFTKRVMLFSSFLLLQDAEYGRALDALVKAVSGAQGLVDQLEAKKKLAKLGVVLYFIGQRSSACG